MNDTHDLDPGRRLITTAEAAEIAHVKVQTIYTWVHRGLIESLDTNDAGEQLYLELDVLQAERNTRRAPRWRRLLTLAQTQPKDTGPD